MTKRILPLFSQHSQKWWNFSVVKTVRLGNIHDLSKFDCGDSDINDFIKNDALTYQQKKLAITTLFIYKDGIIGFFSTAADSLRLKIEEKEEHEVEAKRIKEFPAIKIARLGRDKNFKGKMLGTSILKWAVGYILKCSEMVAVRFITVDALHKRVGWYEDSGFKINTDKHYIKKKDHVSMRYDLFNSIPK